jgi:Leucine-rich repeat (LRR) protein
MQALLTRLSTVAVVLTALTLVNCGSGGKGTNGPALTTYGKDSLAVRNILDANSLQSVEVGGALSPLNNEGTRIGELNLQGKNITVLPKDIGQLTALTALRLDSNGITSLPPEIGNCTALLLLSVAQNGLTGLPSEIGKLKALTNLNLTQNSLASLPDLIGTCDSLKTIRLSGNQLTALPASIMSCPVGYIAVSNNKLCTGAISDALKNWLDLWAESDWAANQNCN